MKRLFYPLFCLAMVAATLVGTGAFPASVASAQGPTPSAGGAVNNNGNGKGYGNGGLGMDMRKNRVTNEMRLAAANAAKVARAQAKAKSSGTVVQPALVVPTVGGVPDYFGIWGNFAYSQLPQTDVSGNVIPGTGIRKFVDTLPGLGPAGANDLGQYVSVAHPDTLTYPGSDYYEIAAVEYQIKMHADLPPTTVRSYVQLNNGTSGSANTIPPDPAQYLGASIVATANKPVRIKFTNLLPTTTHIFVPVDTTIMGAGTGPNGGTELYPDNRVTIHLHGGLTPWISDGTPYQWVAPNLQSTVTGQSSYLKGASVADVPDMPVSPGGSFTMYFTNEQSARLMFYHDHAVGITRLNVYTGLASAYVLTDPTEQDLINGTNLSGNNPGLAKVLPDIGIPLVVQDKTYVPTTTGSFTNQNGTFTGGELSAEDPTWDTVKWGGTGNFWYPHVYMPNQIPFNPVGVTAMGRWDYAPWFGVPGTLNGPVANPYFGQLGAGANGPEPPQIPGVPNVSVTGETYHDTPVINGTAYPTLSLLPQAYRFRILSAGDDRFWNLSLFQAAPLTVSVTASGSGYTTPPTVNINGGSFTTPPTAAANLGVVSFTTPIPGTGYTSPPNVSITSPTGYGATAAAVLNGTGGVASIVSLSVGTGYTAPVTVTLSGGGGTGASVSAILGVTSISIVNRGVASSGAIVNPTITFSGGGGGTGAAAIGSVLSDVAMVPAVVNPALPFPPDWAIPTDGANVITPDILDGRQGGVPDPRYLGPAWLAIGNEGGFLPQVATIAPSPIGFQHNNKNATWNNVTKKSLFLAPAERADVIVDYSQYAGQTLILYSDSPAPVPLYDVRNDNYTNDPDYTAMGGAPSTLAGYGPNTRTLMQIRVAAATPAAAVNVTALNTAIMSAYKLTQDPPLVPASVYNAALGTTYPDDYVRIQDTEFSPAASGQGVSAIIKSANVGLTGFLTSVPTIAISGGGGSGATAAATMAAQDSVVGFLVGAGGSGYSSAPSVVLSGGGGTGASGRAIVTSGTLVRVDVVTGGSGYVSPPNVTLTGGGGTGAFAAAEVGTAFQVTAMGTGYNFATTTVTLSAPPPGPTAVQATATASLGISTVTVLTTGTYTNYLSPPVITVTGGGGSGAVLVPVMALNPIPGQTGGIGAVAGVTVVSPGGGYTTVPTITFSGGAGPTGTATPVQATATAVLGVADIDVTNAGGGYTAPPTVTITDAAVLPIVAGTGATAVAINNTLSTGLLGDILIASAGTGYTTAPQITFVGGGSAANSAAAYAQLTGTIDFHLQPKDVVPVFERYYGRLSMQEGANLVPFYYADPVTEFWQDSGTTFKTPQPNDGTQIWEINGGLGVDTHPLHWHLFNLQVINRIGTDGVIRPPDPMETGWRETVRINPFELLVVAARPFAPKMPFNLPDSIRPLEPSIPIGATGVFTNLTPGGTVTSLTNQMTNFGWEYVWHCHILSHEENDMMRPVTFTTPTSVPTAPTLLTALAAGGNHLTWSDPTPAASSSGNPANEVGFQISRVLGTQGGTFNVVAKVPANTTSYIDYSANLTAGQTYRYKVNGYNNVGTSPDSNILSIAGTVVPTAPLTAPVPTVPAAAASVSSVTPINFTWGTVAGATSYTLKVFSGATLVVNMPGLIPVPAAVSVNMSVPNGVLAPGAYTWQVTADNGKGSSALSAARAFTVIGPPAAPSPLTPASGSTASASANITLTWSAVAGATYGLQVIASNSTAVVNVAGLASPTYTILPGTLARGAAYTWKVNATVSALTSAWSTSFVLKTPAGMVIADFDGDGKADEALYLNGSWYIQQSSNNAIVSRYFGGWAGAVPFAGDFDGDGKADMGLYLNGSWYIQQSSNNAIVSRYFGGWAGAIPIVGDYDGDGKADLALYLNGSWYIQQSSNNAIVSFYFGGWAGAVPVVSDYDGDGKADLALYLNGSWYIQQSSNNAIVSFYFGGWAGAVPVVSDYDGDGKADLALYLNGSWYIQQSSNNAIVSLYFGGWAGAVPF